MADGGKVSSPQTSDLEGNVETCACMRRTAKHSRACRTSIFGSLSYLWREKSLGVNLTTAFVLLRKRNKVAGTVLFNLLKTR